MALRALNQVGGAFLALGFTRFKYIRFEFVPAVAATVALLDHEDRPRWSALKGCDQDAPVELGGTLEGEPAVFVAPIAHLHTQRVKEQALFAHDDRQAFIEAAGVWCVRHRVGDAVA